MGTPRVRFRSLVRGNHGAHRLWSRCGKTTLGRLLAKRTNAVYKELSATDSGIGDVKAVAEEAKRALALAGRYSVFHLVHRPV